MHGAGKWRDDYSVFLAGHHVIILPDNDDAGRSHAISIEQSARAAGATAEVVQLPDLPPKGDVSDWLDAGGTAEQLIAMAAAVPPPTLIDGADLLDRVSGFVASYVSFPSAEAGDAVTLWAAHTHALSAFESTPRLALLSAEKQSGKTRCLEVLDLLVRNAKHSSNLTAAALFRLVGSGAGVTLLFDEVDAFFGNRAKEHEDLRGLLNAGHRRGAVAHRCVGDAASMEVREFPAFCPVALAGIGDLPDTILDRSVLIRMQRRAAGETVRPFRHREAAPAGHELRALVGQWARQHEGDLRDARPVMPEGITDRPADVWEPMLTIADVAGGDWPERARRAAIRLNQELQSADTSLGVRLLMDIRRVFETNGADRITSAALADALGAIEDAPWGEIRGKALDARGLAGRLRPYGIKPHSVRMDDKTPKGYEQTDFSDAWRRYVPTSIVEAQRAQQPQQQGSPSVASAGTVADGERNTPPQAQHRLQVSVAAVAAVALPRETEAGADRAHARPPRFDVGALVRPLAGTGIIAAKAFRVASPEWFAGGKTWWYAIDGTNRGYCEEDLELIVNAWLSGSRS